MRRSPKYICIMQDVFFFKSRIIQIEDNSNIVHSLHCHVRTFLGWQNNFSINLNYWLSLTYSNPNTTQKEAQEVGVVIVVIQLEESIAYRE